eukprot:gene20404-27183_t
MDEGGNKVRQKRARRLRRNKNGQLVHSEDDSNSESDGKGGRRRVRMRKRRASVSTSDGKGGRQRRGKGKHHERKKYRRKRIGADGEEIWSSGYDSSYDDSYDDSYDYDSESDSQCDESTRDGMGGRKKKQRQRRRRRRRRTGLSQASTWRREKWTRPGKYDAKGDGNEEMMFSMYGWQRKAEVEAPIVRFDDEKERPRLDAKASMKLRDYLSRATKEHDAGNNSKMRSLARKIVRLLGTRILLPMLLPILSQPSQPRPEASSFQEDAPKDSVLMYVIPYTAQAKAEGSFVPAAVVEVHLFSNQPRVSASLDLLDPQARTILNHRMNKHDKRWLTSDPGVGKFSSPDRLRSTRLHRKANLASLVPPTALSTGDLDDGTVQYQLQKYMRQRSHQEHVRENVLRRLSQHELTRKPLNKPSQANLGHNSPRGGGGYAPLGRQATEQTQHPHKIHMSESRPQAGGLSPIKISDTRHRPNSPGGGAGGAGGLYLHPPGFLPQLLSQSHDSALQGGMSETQGRQGGTGQGPTRSGLPRHLTPLRQSNGGLGQPSLPNIEAAGSSPPVTPHSFVSPRNVSPLKSVARPGDPAGGSGQSSSYAQAQQYTQQYIDSAGAGGQQMQEGYFPVRRGALPKARGGARAKSSRVGGHTPPMRASPTLECDEAVQQVLADAKRAVADANAHKVKAHNPMNTKISPTKLRPGVLHTQTPLISKV